MLRHEANAIIRNFQTAKSSIARDVAEAWGTLELNIPTTIQLCETLATRNFMFDDCDRFYLFEDDSGLLFAESDEDIRILNPDEINEYFYGREDPDPPLGHHYWER